MMVNIANPIYDSVFKYLMEDERIAKTLISALLKKDFDQSLKEKGNHQVLSVDEDKFNGDLEMMHILHRLITAASDSKLRQDMNVEDEFFSAIENRDTALMQKDKTIAEQKEQIHSMVKAMLGNGMSIETISNITKIPLEEISEMTK